MDIDEVVDSFDGYIRHTAKNRRDYINSGRTITARIHQKKADAAAIKHLRRQLSPEIRNAIKWPKGKTPT